MWSQWVIPAVLRIEGSVVAIDIGRSQYRNDFCFRLIFQSIRIHRIFGSVYLDTILKEHFINREVIVADVADQGVDTVFYRPFIEVIADPVGRIVIQKIGGQGNFRVFHDHVIPDFGKFRIAIV